MPGPHASLVGLDELLEEGLVVVSFNRGHWCPFCKIELKTLADFYADFSAAGARVNSILPDRQKYAGRLDGLTRQNVLVLSDIDNAYSLGLGLVLWLGDRLHELMEGRGHHLDDYQGADGWFVPLPATFVVGRDGRVAARHIDPDFRTRMDPREILTALKLLAPGG